MLSLLPDELVRHIKSFLIVCECCHKLTVDTKAMTCVFCKRSWCVECDVDKYIGYSYFEVELLTCRWCLYELRIPRYLGIYTV